MFVQRMFAVAVPLADDVNPEGSHLADADLDRLLQLQAQGLDFLSCYQQIDDANLRAAILRFVKSLDALIA